jgi:hypothetical protein
MYSAGACHKMSQNVVLYNNCIIIYILLVFFPDCISWAESISHENHQSQEGTPLQVARGDDFYVVSFLPLETI